MSSRIDSIISRLGATRVVRLPDCGGGSFGAARVGHIMSGLLAESTRAKSPLATDSSDPSALNMTVSAALTARLSELAARTSSSGNPISTAELATKLLEDAIQRCEREQSAAV